MKIQMARSPGPERQEQGQEPIGRLVLIRDGEVVSPTDPTPGVGAEERLRPDLHGGEPKR